MLLALSPQANVDLAISVDFNATSLHLIVLEVAAVDIAAQEELGA